MSDHIDPLVEEGYLDRDAAEDGYAALTVEGLEALARCEGPFALEFIDKDGELLSVTVGPATELRFPFDGRPI